jgi:hypothetical protein
MTSASSKSTSSTLTVREPATYAAVPHVQQHGLAVRAPGTVVPLVQAFRICRSCGFSTHTLNDCPQLYYSDTNTDHTCDWVESTLGQAWKAAGFDTWQERFVLPGYETRVQYHPPGSKPYLMASTNKRQRNQHGSSLENNTQANQGYNPQETQIRVTPTRRRVSSSKRTTTTRTVGVVGSTAPKGSTTHHKIKVRT